MKPDFVEILKQRRDHLQCRDLPEPEVVDEYGALQELAEFFEPEAVVLEDGIEGGIWTVCPNCGSDPFDPTSCEGNAYGPEDLDLINSCGVRYCINCGKALKVPEWM